MSDSEGEESKSSSDGSSSEWENSDNQGDSDDGSDVQPEQQENLEVAPAAPPEHPEEGNNNTEEAPEGESSSKSVEHSVEYARRKKGQSRQRTFSKNAPELLPRSIDESCRRFVWECDDFVIKAEFNEDVRKIPKPQYRSKPDMCPVCKEMCYSEKALDKHVREIHPDVEKPFVCPCGSKFDRMKMLRRHTFHLHTEEGNKIWRNILDAKNKRRRGVPLSREYKDKANARRRLTTRGGNKYQSRVHGSWSRLGESDFWVNRDAPPPHKCPECEEKFETITRLRRHHADIHQERVNICETCGKGFTTRESLNGHLRSHNEDRKYVCDECGISCKTLHHLNIHIKRTHDEQGREEYKLYLKEVKQRRKLRLLKQAALQTIEPPADIDLNEILYGSSSSTT